MFQGQALLTLNGYIHPVLHDSRHEWHEVIRGEKLFIQ